MRSSSVARVLTIVFTLIAMLGTSIVSAQEADDSTNPGMSDETWTNSLIHKKLEQKTDLNFDETPFGEIEEQLEKALQVNIVLDQSAEDDSLASDEPITINVSGLKTNHALSIMREKKNATFVVDRGVIRIISLDDAEDTTHFSRRIFRVDALLQWIETNDKRVGTPREDVRRRGFGSGKHGGVFAISNKNGTTQPKTQDDDDDDEDDEDEDQDQDEIRTIPITAEFILEQTITGTVQPDAWQDTGQGLCTFKLAGGLAIVTGPEKLLAEVESLLEDLHFHATKAEK